MRRVRVVGQEPELQSPHKVRNLPSAIAHAALNPPVAFTFLDPQGRSDDGWIGYPAEDALIIDGATTGLDQLRGTTALVDIPSNHQISANHLEQRDEPTP